MDGTTDNANRLLIFAPIRLARSRRGRRFPKTDSLAYGIGLNISFVPQINRLLTVGECVVASLHFLGRDFLDAVSNIPTMSERIAEASGSLAIKVILRWNLDLRTEALCPRDHFIGVVDMELSRAICRRVIPRRRNSTLGEFSVEIELRMPDPSGAFSRDFSVAPNALQ